MARKRGKFSTKEEEHIRRGVAAGLDFETIASQLNRTPQTVEKFARENNLTYAGMSEDVYDDTILRAKLEERPYWGEVQLQFSQRELEYFAVSWIRIMKQFREDILYAEEIQLKELITLEIMTNKVLRDRLGSQQQMDRIQALLDAEYALPEDDRDATVITNLEQEIAMLRNSQGSFTAEHVKILDKKDKIQRDLKAARADRVRKVEDSKSSFSGFLKSLDDEEIRKKVGEDIEISKLGKDQAIKNLSKFHKYEDGQVDQPLLTPETAKD